MDRQSLLGRAIEKFVDDALISKSIECCEREIKENLRGWEVSQIGHGFFKNYDLQGKGAKKLLEVSASI